MAFVKKPLQGGVKEFLEDYSVDLENRIGDIGKADIGLDNVVNRLQAQVIHSENTNTTTTIEIPGNYGLFLLTGGWSGLNFCILVVKRMSGQLSLTDITNRSSSVTITTSENNINIDTKSNWNIISLVKLNN